MIAQTFAIGTGIASDLPDLSQGFTSLSTPPATVGELLQIIAQLGDKNLPMLRTTAVRLSEYANTPVTELSLEVLVDIRSPLSRYLKDRRYAPNSIRTYRQNTQRLLRWAERLGWASEKQSVEEAWSPILSALSKKPRAYTSIVFYAIEIGKTPSQFSTADINAWGRMMIEQGRQHRTVRQAKWNFRRALAEANVENLVPQLMSTQKTSTYRVPVRELPEPLQSEVADILVWKQARFARGRPQRTRHRPVSAKLLESQICRLFGFATKIAGFPNVTSLSSLFTEDIVSAFIEWGLNVRGLTRSSLLRLSMIYGALRHHPKYKDHGYSWFTSLFNEVPEDDQSRIQEKKAEKSVPYEELCKIPAATKAARQRLEPDDPRASRLAQDELLILWLTTLPWRQRNIRQCRIGDPKTSNIFYAPLPNFAHIAKAGWVKQALEKEPNQSFWQFHFREHETKTGQQVRGILPRRLIPALEEFISVHRPRLLGGTDPGTLFVNADGSEIDDQTMTYHISEIVLKHTGRRMTPHLFRDAFAYAYLAANPEDFLSLSKILWHSSIKYTLSVYGRNFDESNGARRIDEWLGAAA